MDGKSINWSLGKHLELAKKENLASLFNWVFGVCFNCTVLLTVSFPNISDTLSWLQNSYDKFSIQQIKEINSLFTEFTEKENLFSRVILFKSKDAVSANAFYRSFKIVSNVWKLSEMLTYLASKIKLFWSLGRSFKAGWK